MTALYEAEVLAQQTVGVGLAAPAPADATLSKPPSRLLIRKWLKILINRSLVLGTVDRPQLHDIVLDYVIKQHPKDVLASAHRVAIELFRARRPAQHGWTEDNLSTDDQTGLYIVREVSYHVANALALTDKSEWDKDLQIMSWLNDFYFGQDAIPFETAVVLGREKVLALSDSSWEAGHLWISALQRSLVAMSDKQYVGKDLEATSLDRVCEMCTDIRNQMRDKDSTQVTPSEDDLNILNFSALWNLIFAGEIKWWRRWTKQFVEVGQSNVMRSNPIRQYQLLIANTIHPANLLGDPELSRKSVYKHLELCIQNRKNPDLPESAKRMWYGQVRKKERQKD